MPLTEQEIKNKWAKLHHTLGLVYYQPLGKFANERAPTASEISKVESALGRSITDMDKATFDSVHGALWIACESELKAAGYGGESPPPAPAPPPEPEPDPDS